MRCAFQPLSHSAERLNTGAVLLNGGRVCVYGGGVENLLSVLPLVRPTLMNAPPRFWNFIHSEFVATVQQMLDANRGTALLPRHRHAHADTSTEPAKVTLGELR